MRGDLFSLVRLILQDKEIWDAIIEKQKKVHSNHHYDELKNFMEKYSRAKRNQPETVIEACRLLFKKGTVSARTLLLMSIKTVKERTRK